MSCLHHVAALLSWKLIGNYLYGQILLSCLVTTAWQVAGQLIHLPLLSSLNWLLVSSCYCPLVGWWFQPMGFTFLLEWTVAGRGYLHSSAVKSCHMYLIVCGHVNEPQNTQQCVIVVLAIPVDCVCTQWAFTCKLEAPVVLSLHNCLWEVAEQLTSLAGGQSMHRVNMCKFWKEIWVPGFPLFLSDQTAKA